MFKSIKLWDKNSKVELNMLPNLLVELRVWNIGYITFYLSYFFFFYVENKLRVKQQNMVYVCSAPKNKESSGKNMVLQNGVNGGKIV